MTTKINPASASLRDLYILNRTFQTAMDAVQMKDPRTKDIFSASPFMVFLLHHIQTRPDMVKNRERYWCLDGWKVSMILQNVRDIFDKYGIDISQLHIEK